MLNHYLDDLEARIDPDEEDRLEAAWAAFWRGDADTGIFSPRRESGPPPGIAWPAVRVNETLDDPEKMVLRQLALCSETLAQGSGAILNVRANYGTGILSSIFGATVFRMDDVYNTLPTTRALEGGAEAVRRLLDQGAPDLATGFGGACFETGGYFRERFQGYPKISKYVHIYHPDLQGPMDIVELLWGSDLFLALIDTPDRVHALLDRVTETYARFMRQWEALIPPRDGLSAHWGMLHRGRLMLRDDSAMNLSAEMFDAFIRPYDQRLLAEFGGGVVHFCGRGDHYIRSLTEMNGLFAVNLSQPEYNDMEHIFRHTVDRGIPLIGFSRAAAEAALAQGRDLHGRVHCQ